MPVSMSCKGIFSQELYNVAIFHVIASAFHEAGAMEMKRSRGLIIKMADNVSMVGLG